MSRIDFMSELEGLLSDIPMEERNEAIKYYNDYFEDAGEDHEEEIIKELGSPARIAGIIKADLNLSGEDHENRGYFTEKGFQDTVYADERYEIIKTARSAEGESSNQSETSSQQAGSSGHSYEGTGNGNGTNQQKSNNTNTILIILLAIFAIPIGVPMFFAVFGTLFGLMAALFGIVIGFGAAGVCMIPAGVVLFIIGLIQMNVPIALLSLCGSGLLVFGLGILFLLSSVMICKKLLPAMIRGTVNLCRLPFKNRRVTV